MIFVPIRKTNIIQPLILTVHPRTAIASELTRDSLNWQPGTARMLLVKRPARSDLPSQKHYNCTAKDSKVILWIIFIAAWITTLRTKAKFTRRTIIAAQVQRVIYR